MIRTVAAISLVYDLSAGVSLLLLRAPIARLVPSLARLLGPSPVLGDLLGLFLTCVGIGYLLPYREPVVYRSYIWIFGVALKNGGSGGLSAGLCDAEHVPVDAALRSERRRYRRALAGRARQRRRR